MYKIIIISVISIFFMGCNSNKELSISKKCHEIPNAGKCRAMFTKYYFNVEENKCEKFIWGGCGGNIPFKTLESCKSTCER